MLVLRFSLAVLYAEALLKTARLRISRHFPSAGNGEQGGSGGSVFHQH